MSRRRSTNTLRPRDDGRSSAKPLEAIDAFERSITLIRQRLLVVKSVDQTLPALVQAERISFQVRKIVEGVAFLALSAAELRNRHPLVQQRTKDADQILSWLDSKQMLELPSAQRASESEDPGYAAVFRGAGPKDLDLAALKTMFSRASAMVHERHPERLTPERVNRELAVLKEDGQRLYEWLWLHIMFLKGEAILVQMGQFGTPSFIQPLVREGGLPEGFQTP